MSRCSFVYDSLIVHFMLPKTLTQLPDMLTPLPSAHLLYDTMNDSKQRHFCYSGLGIFNGPWELMGCKASKLPRSHVKIQCFNNICFNCCFVHISKISWSVFILKSLTLLTAAKVHHSNMGLSGLLWELHPHGDQWVTLLHFMVLIDSF